MKSARDILIDAAKALLWDIGYEAMSPRKVLQKSGVGHGSLYHHFSGKRELASAALTETGEEMRAEFDAIADSGRRPLERIHRYLSLQDDGLKGCQLGRLANEQAINDDDIRKPIARYFRHVELRIETALREAIACGDLPNRIDPRRTAQMMVATIQGGYILSRVHRDSGYVQDAARGASLLLLMLSSQ